MLDDVERRRFLVDPARKDPLPVLAAALHVQLQERTGELFQLPWSSGLASAQPHDRIAHANRLAGLQHQVADDSVALVEQADDRHSLAHRSDARLVGGRLRKPDVDRRRRCLILLR